MQTDELIKLAKKGKLEALESAWMSVVGDGDAPVGELLAVPELLAERGQAEAAESLLWFLVDSLRESGRTAEAQQAARAGGRILPRSDVFRELLKQLYRDSHGERNDISDLIRITLDDGGMPLDEATAALDALLTLRPGDYVLDRRDGKVGRVVGPDPGRGGLVVELQEGQKLYGGSMVARLEPAPEDDFRAMLAFDRERLKRLASQNPEELVRIALVALGPRAELRRLRLYLEPVVGQWARWWSRAREALKRSAQIGMTEGRSPSLFLRRKPVSHADRLLKRFSTAQGPVARLAVALELARDAEAHEGLDEDAVRRLAGEVQEIARESAEASAPVAVAAAAVAEELDRAFADLAMPARPEAPVQRALGDPDGFAAALGEGAVFESALEFIQRNAPEVWADFFAELMPLVGREGCQAVAVRLAAAGAKGALAEAAREILARPDAHPGALGWLWRACTGGFADVLRPAVDPPGVALQALSTLAGLVRAPDLTDERRKELIAELRGSLFARGGASLREAFEAASTEQVAAARALAERNPALTPLMRDELLGLLREREPALFEKALAPWEEGVIYTTQAGIERRRAELEEIVNVRLPAVMREIGAAAGFGDVSDNAEYRAALEERSRLAERAARIQAGLAQTRLITHELACADHVTVGSRVRARNLESGEVESLTFLGPWDARPEEGIYAYNAPLGLAFMGKKPGEQVELRVGSQERRWEILQVEPAV